MSFDNLERINETYYASMHVPPDVRDVLGKRRFRKSLRTKDRRTAIQRARPVIDQWWLEIHQARRSLSVTPDKLTQDALAWREELVSSRKDPDQHELISGLIVEKAEELTEQDGSDVAQVFYGVATGRATPLSPLIPTWKDYVSKAVKPKTLVMYVADVERMAKSIKTLESFTRGRVRAWLWGLAESTPDGLTEKTQRRILNGLSNFWRWCHAQGLLDEDARNPTIGVATHKGAQPRTKRKPFTPEEIAQLCRSAIARDDHALADLVLFGAYTGGRIEELCSVTREDVSPSLTYFTVRDAKTEAGNRDVPIHHALRPVIDRLMHDSADGYLIPSSAQNNHGKRSDPLGKRFGRLKGELGFGKDLVFHSIRKTVATLLENAGVPEGIAADILGHEKTTMTYGLYSGGSSMENKLAAIERLVFPDAMTSSQLTERSHLEIPGFNMG
jgi:integrase